MFGDREIDLPVSIPEFGNEVAKVRHVLACPQCRGNCVFKHGYPTDPSCFTFDPATRLLAIGTRGGFVMLYGRPGVEQTFVHDPPTAVTQIIFIPNTVRYTSAKFLSSARLAHHMGLLGIPRGPQICNFSP
eukprot:sb/3475022/